MKAEEPQPFTEEELVEMAAAAEEPGPELSGGAMSNLHLTYVVIALAATGELADVRSFAGNPAIIGFPSTYSRWEESTR